MTNEGLDKIANAIKICAIKIEKLNQKSVLEFDIGNCWVNWLFKAERWVKHRPVNSGGRVKYGSGVYGFG